MKKFISNEWNQATAYFQGHLKTLFYLMVLLFTILIGASTAYFFYHPELTQALYLDLVAVFENKIASGSQGIDLLGGIFFNNLWAAGMAILLGFIPFLFIPFWTLTSNALIIGIVGGIYKLSGFGVFAFLIGILPHGLLEIPAFILAVTLGLDLSFKLIKVIFKKNKGQAIRETVKNTIRLYFLWIVPLLFLAAIIETYMTPVLFGLVS